MAIPQIKSICVSIFIEFRMALNKKSIGNKTIKKSSGKRRSFFYNLEQNVVYCFVKVNA
jgi:hypothetical protein